MTAQAELLTRAELAPFTELKPARAIAWLAFDWAVILAAFALASQAASPWSWVLAAAVILNRQHALCVLLHDAAHFRLLPSRTWNDRISDWLIAYPLNFTTAGFRAGHLRHHQFLGTDQDPDRALRLGKREWTFPMPKRQLALLFVRLALGGSILYIRETVEFYKRLPENRSFAKGGVLSGRTLHFVLAAALVIVAKPWIFVALWTVCSLYLPLAMRVRCVAEHSAVPSGGSLAGTRNYFEHPVLKALLAPHNISYHLDHHLAPMVPFYNLPALHSFLRGKKEYRPGGQSPAGLLKALTASPARASAI